MCQISINLTFYLSFLRDTNVTEYLSQFHLPYPSHKHLDRCYDLVCLSVPITHYGFSFATTYSTTQT